MKTLCVDIYDYVFCTHAVTQELTETRSDEDDKQNMENYYTQDTHDNFGSPKNCPGSNRQPLTVKTGLIAFTNSHHWRPTRHVYLVIYTNSTLK